ncbi:lipoprotein-releasing ABC transporter permease subunit [Desulfohalobium retbaense]|uniref:Lipoprotein releasing system, transmembrane protein, LolC/E family n=1 Tax=Desulfohalobium retbaense (strain ATCC 49708 / DSM 5692 / JCM 16813 / HR100) TaxID=485915 RepID=C8X520_DESRD|nr:lipoprotein-releasing ABC transporter permease subunit [Desulfohalobium retbaense]ACV69517.1 lipoprotein releasing system, transmembrane protein, LolC/E family [Desulfohalobium retbaense DSM 5692]
MGFERFIAVRYLLARRKQTFISVISLISVLGVGLGVAALIVVLGVMNGFSNELRDKILGVNAHVIVGATSGGFADYEQTAETVRRVQGVTGVMPFIYSEVMCSTPHGVKGAALRGIDPERAPEVLNLGEQMVQGSLQALTEPGEYPGIILGQDLADRLGVFSGRTINLLSPSGQSSAAGFSPKIKIFRVVGVFESGMYEYDSSLAYVGLPAARDLLGFGGELVTGLEVRLADVYQAPQIGEAVLERLDPSRFYVRNWMEMNESFFSALKLEKTAMSVILVMIVLVGSFSIITTLIMLVMEKTKDIAILISMGAQAHNIRNIFMLQGTIIGFVGTGLGYALGLGVCFLLDRYQFIRLPGDVYYLDHLPVQLEWLDMGLIGVAALGLCFLATLYPARQASRLEPAEALRYE